MLTEADAVVVGAGALGLSVGYHLARLGRRVAILDQFAPGSQTSPRAAGLFKLIQGDEARTRLAQLSIRTVSRFEADTGIALAVVRSGSLMAARTAEHADLIEREARRSAAWGVGLELVDRDEARRLAPFLQPEGIRAACHTPADLFIEEPASLLQAYARAAEGRGASILGQVRVTGIRLTEGEVTGVVTDQGEIATRVAVDAAGAWARPVGELVGAAVPLVPVRHQLLITEPIAGVEPDHAIVRLIDTAVYVRPARGGLMLGGFEADPLPLDVAAQRPGFSIADVPLDASVLKRLSAGVDRNVPALRDAAVKEHRGGLFTMTPDGQLVVGPHPDLRGFWIATGCNGSGFSLSAGIGQVLSEWIVDGQPSVDLRACAPARFQGQRFGEADLRSRGIWQYTHYYEPAVPSTSSRPA